MALVVKIYIFPRRSFFFTFLGQRRNAPKTVLFTWSETLGLKELAVVLLVVQLGVSCILLSEASDAKLCKIT